MKQVIGVFNDRNNAEEAIRDCESNGYQAKDISIIMRDREEGQQIAHDTGASVADGAVSGAATGAVVGGIAGLLTGIGAIAIPGIGGLLIGGPIAAALGLTGAAAATVSGATTGAVAGGLLGALMGLGLPKEDAQMYQRHIEQGAILLIVPVRSGNESEVRHMLEENNATDIRVINMDDRYMVDDAGRTRHAYGRM